MAKNPDRRRIDEVAARNSAARTLLGIFDSLYEGAVAVDAEARVTWMNDKYRALLGLNGTEPIEGRPIEEVIPDSQLRRVVNTGRADLLDIFTVNGRQLVVSRIPLHDEAGKIIGGLGVILYDRLQALQPIIAKVQALQDDLAAVRRELAASRRAKYGFSQFIGGCPAVRDLKAQARRAAARDATVLLLGETGTGKELLAHAIHGASPRSAKPLVRINAAAIPDTLLEAELFGVWPGAFTGAGSKPRPGKFELAHGGTLFLDEVGDMPLAVQAKLLRALQEREVEPLGSNRVISVDVRLIAATSRDLPAMVAAGTFRADLYYRLNVLPLNIPPLRQRSQDLPLLAEALLEKIAAANGLGLRDLSADAVDALRRWHWPGNVRELGNVLEQAMALDGAGAITGQQLATLLPVAKVQALPQAAPKAVRPLREAMLAAERAALLAALDSAGGVKLQAAKLLGISRAQFYEKLAHHDLSDSSDDRRAV